MTDASITVSRFMTKLCKNLEISSMKHYYRTEKDTALRISVQYSLKPLLGILVLTLYRKMPMVTEPIWPQVIFHFTPSYRTFF